MSKAPLQIVAAALLLALGALALSACGTANGEEDNTPETSNISWSEVEAVLASGDVKMIFQTHALAVTLSMKDGTQFETTEPHIDEIFRLVDECGDPCSGIGMATE